ncbi:hypothetical protein [Umezawaea tangerina]|uniref:hypothetical protein n=1 Tax=Umezawaea tangerina TaxID=84725 RepID=UPI0011B1EE60|nr:hypothetical protein [Umezawaea tangerina]
MSPALSWARMGGRVGGKVAVLRTALLLLGAPACLTGPPPTRVVPAGADCAAFTVLGDARSPSGATWTCRSTDQGVRYALEGVLFTPAGGGPHPAVVISHGRNGDAGKYSARIARAMIDWVWSPSPRTTPTPRTRSTTATHPTGPTGPTAPTPSCRCRRTKRSFACSPPTAHRTPGWTTPGSGRAATHFSVNTELFEDTDTHSAE